MAQEFDMDICRVLPALLRNQMQRTPLVVCFRVRDFKNLKKNDGLQMLVNFCISSVIHQIRDSRELHFGYHPDSWEVPTAPIQKPRPCLILFWLAASTLRLQWMSCSDHGS